MYSDVIYDSYLRDKKETKIPIITFSFELIEYGNSSYIEDSKDKKLIIKYYYFTNKMVIS